MKKIIPATIVVITSVSALAGCSPQKTPESVSMDFLKSVIGDSGRLPSEFMCGGSAQYDNDRWYEPATDLKVSKTEEADNRGRQRVWIDYRTPGGGDEHATITVDLRDMCVAAAQ